MDVVTEFAMEGALSELLYADDLVMMSETTDGLRNKFLERKEVFQSKYLMVILGKTKMMVSSVIMKDGLSKSKIDPCGVYSLRVRTNSVLYVQCGKWIHDRCARVKRVTASLSINFACRICEGDIGEAVEQEETLCDEVETVRSSCILVTGYVQVEDVRLL